METSPGQAVSAFGATTRCDDCTIFIGAGHVEGVPYGTAEDSGLLCRPCRETSRRRATRPPIEIIQPERPHHRPRSLLLRTNPDALTRLQRWGVPLRRRTAR